MNVHPMAIKNICGAGKMDGYRKKGNIYDMVWILAAAKTWNMLPDGYQKRLRVTKLVTALHDTL
jgi:hypothetical protein